MKAARRVAVFTDDVDWHGARLAGAFAARGVEPIFLSLRDCSFELGASANGPRLPGFDGEMPDGVFVRMIAAGTLEQITFRLSVLHALRELSIPVYNDARGIERTVDKAMTSFLLRRAGLSTPATWVCESRDGAERVLARELRAGRELVLKPLFGSQGKGLRRLEPGSALPPEEEVMGVYYLQRFVPPKGPGWCDWRVLVVGGRAIVAMARHGQDWVTNVRQGARCVAASPEGALGRLAVRAAQAVGADYAGVDIIRDGGDRLRILEVNSMPAWKGLQGVTGLDIAQCLVDDFLSRIGSAGSIRAIAS